MTENDQAQAAALPRDIARDIVSRFAWTSNVMIDGHMVGLGVAVEKAIADAIVADRERIAASRATPADPALDPVTVERMLQGAYNEGVSEGMREHTSFNGGKLWRESKTYRALASGEERK